MPTFNDLYYTFIGNTFLKPEYAKQINLGVTYVKSFRETWLTRLSVQADAYYNLVTDKIVAVPGANLFRWTMMNLGKVQVKGLTVNAQSAWEPRKNLRFTGALSYTYEQSIDITGGLNDHYGQLIPYAPLNSGSLLLGGELKRFALNYSFIYTGYRYDQAANIPANYVQPWYTHDMALVYNTAYQTHKIKVSAEVNNLLNQYYDVIVNFPMPGRNYRFTFQFTW
jgi:outer membrane receptor protein involved in Fe transport